MNQDQTTPKHALVTGAGSGIGAAISRRLSKMGFDILLVGRSMEKLEKVASSLESKAYTFSCDLKNPGDIVKFCGELKGPDSPLQGKLEALVNNAGIFERLPFDETSDAGWREMFETNLFGPVTLCRELLPLMKSADQVRTIINISSTLGLRPMEQTSSYSASKSAMVNWTQSLALESAPFGIRVNAVCPGLVETPIHDWHGTDNKETLKTLNDLHPLGRMGQPDDIAGAVSYLVSEDSSWVTGTIMQVDGGINLRS